MQCPYCGNSNQTSVIDTVPDAASGGIRRRRECKHCGSRFSTYERPILSTPMIIKAGGYREEFDRDKVLRGLKTACVKRPVSAEDLESLVDRVEDRLRRIGLMEVPSHVVGDMVIEGLKSLDIIAYIRYAIVYLKLDNLASIREEIDKLIEEQNLVTSP
jgi:transcriptional repressor NrdR